MSVINDRSSVTGVATPTRTGADTALELGAKVLAQLATQPPSTSMSVPTSMMQDLAAAVVQLAAQLKEAQGATTNTPQPSAPKVNADIKVSSGFSAASDTAHKDLKEIASSVREKCAELGINLKVEVSIDFGSWFLSISGQAPKADLDKVKAHALTVATKNATYAQGVAKVEVLKYETI